MARTGLQDVRVQHRVCLCVTYEMVCATHSVYLECVMNEVYVWCCTDTDLGKPCRNYTCPTSRSHVQQLPPYDCFTYDLQVVNYMDGVPEGHDIDMQRMRH